MPDLPGSNPAADATPLRLLLLEDSAYDAELAVATLTAAGYACTWRRVDTRDALLAEIETGGFDLVLADYGLPNFDGLSALQLVRQRQLDLPFIFVSGVMGEERAIECMKAGATDYVLKTGLSRLVPVVQRALKDRVDQRRRREAEAALETEAEINAALARVGQELIGALNAPDLLERLCQLTAETLGCDISYVALRNREAKAYELVAASGDVPTSLAALRNVALPADLLIPHTERLAREQLLTIGEEGRMPWQTFVPSREATPALCAGLFQGETLLGALVACYRQRTLPFTAVEQRLARGIAQLGSLALVDAQALEHLRKANQLKSEFLATVSHELRTPLNHVIGFTDLVREDAHGLSEEQAEALGVVARSSRELLQLINGLLDTGRLEAGQLPLERQETNAGELLNELVTEIPPAARTAAVEIVRNILPGLPVLATDRIKLKLILHHLIDNALKFTALGTVTIGAAASGGGVEFTVSDTGIGIPREFLPVIFEPFRQADGSTTRRYGGVGLGLYMVHRLVDLLGGTIAVDSEVGRGSTFRVWLPRARGGRPVPTTVPGDATALYAELLDATTDLIFSTAVDGHILYANQAWRTALGYDTVDLTRLSIFDILHPTAAARYAATCAPEAAEAHTLELTFLRKDGRTVETEGRLRWRVVDGRRISSQGILRDVTRSKAAEAALTETREWLDLAAQSGKTGLWSWNVQSGETRYSSTWSQLLGYAEHEFSGTWEAWWALVHPDDREGLLAVVQDMVARCAPGYETEFRLRHRDGTYRWIMSRASLHNDAEGRPLRILGTHTDITERKQERQRLADSEERYQAVVNHAADAILIHDAFGVIREVNPAACTSLGYTLDELIGRPMTDIDPHLDPERVRHLLQQIWGGMPVMFEAEHRRKDGSTFPVEGCSVRFTWNGESHVLGIVRDVTERKRAEAALRQSENHYRALVEQAHDAIYTHDPLGNYTSVNPAMERMSGYTRAELLTMNAAQLVVAEDFQLSLDSDPGSYVMRIRTKDGGVITVDIRSRPVLRDGTVVGWEGLARDVTERQRMESALREAQSSLQLATESAKVAVWKSDLRTFRIRFSSGWKRVLGYDENEITLAALWNLVDPDDRAKATAAVQEHLQGRTNAYEVEQRMLHADGRYRWVLSRGRAAFDTEGTPAYLLGADIDISERKVLEEALRKAQTSLQLATERARVALWTSDLRALTIHFSSGWQRVLGRQETEFPLAALWDLVHPDDRGKSAAAMQEHLEGHTPAYEIEQRMLHVDGTYRWVLSRGMATHDPEGRRAYFFGADIDITERKTLEEALRRSEEQFRHLVEDITDVIYAADRDGRVTYMSPVAERLYGYAPAEVVDRPFSEFIFPEDLQGVDEGFREAISGDPHPHDHRVVSKSGEVRWVRNHTRIILDGNQIVGLRGVMSDVTERRRAEDALRALTMSLEQQVAERTRDLSAAHERLRLITDNMSDMVSQVNQHGIFEYVSPAQERLLGYAPLQVIGKSMLEYVHPDDYARVIAAVQGTIRSAPIGQVEFRCRHTDGHYVWLETVGKLLFDERGATVGAVLNSRDVTERRLAEQRVRESEERFSSAFEFAAIGMALVAPDGRWLRVNRALCTLVGYSREELLAKTFQDITHPDDLGADLENVRRMLAGDIETYQMEKRYFHKSGRVVWIQLTVSMVRDDRNQPLCFVSQIQDITERKQWGAELDGRRRRRA